MNISNLYRPHRVNIAFLNLVAVNPTRWRFYCHSLILFPHLLSSILTASWLLHSCLLWSLQTMTADQAEYLSEQCYTTIWEKVGFIQFLFGLHIARAPSRCSLLFQNLTSIIGDHIPGYKIYVTINPPVHGQTITSAFRNDMERTNDLTDWYRFHDFAWLSGDSVKIYRMVGISKIIRNCRKNCCTVSDSFHVSDRKRVYQLNRKKMLHSTVL